MLVATFGSSTAWAGRTISFQDDQFTLEGHGAVSAADILEYDRQGHLVWPYPGMRAWIGATAAAAGAEPSAEGVAPIGEPASVSIADGRIESPVRGAASLRGGTPSKRVLALTGALATLAIALLAVVTLSSASDRPGDAGGSSGPAAAGAASATPQPQATATTWADYLEGTWVPTGEDGRLVISHTTASASIRIEETYDSWDDLTFEGDMLTVTQSDHPTDPSTFRRTVETGGQYVGTYEATTVPTQDDQPNAAVHMSFEMDEVLIVSIDQGYQTVYMRFTLLDNGQMLEVAFGSGGATSTQTFTRW